MAKVAKKAIIARHLSQLVANAVGQHQAYEPALAITALDPQWVTRFRCAPEKHISGESGALNPRATATTQQPQETAT